VQDRIRFESLLAELSATFVNLSADQVDSQIESALRRIVVCLGLDRGSLADLLANQKQIVLTHSYHISGIPPRLRIILDEQLPWYTSTISGGEVIRYSTPPDAPPPLREAERDYCLRVGMKAHVRICAKA
jgi:hypothetical protein